MGSYKLQRVDLKTQTIEKLLEYIKDMNLLQSSKLPREEELAKILGVSRITIREALNSLASDGIVFRQQGKGTFVNTSSIGINVSFTPAKPFFHLITSCGLSPGAEHLYDSIEKATLEVATALSINEGEEVFACKKLLYASGVPCTLIVDYLNINDFEEGYFDDIHQYSDSIFKFLYEKSGIKITWDKVEIDTVLSTDLPELSAFNNPDGSPTPLLLIKGFCCDENNREIMYSYEYINTKIIKFNQIRRREIVY